MVLCLTPFSPQALLSIAVNDATLVTCPRKTHQLKLEFLVNRTGGRSMKKSR